MTKELQTFLENNYKTISINYTQFEIANSSSFNDLQEGYRLNTKLNKSFVGVNQGEWKESWHVVGYLRGDPVFIDITDNAVYTAMHGQGHWQEEKICNSLTEFKFLLDNLTLISKHREYPVKFKNNPITKKELALYASAIAQTNADQDFWLQFVDIWHS